jgi:hypothetical protein
MHAIADTFTAVEWTKMALAAVVTVGFWGSVSYLTRGRRRLANLEYEQERQRKQVNRLDIKSQGPEIETPADWKTNLRNPNHE